MHNDNEIADDKGRTGSDLLRSHPKKNHTDLGYMLKCGNMYLSAVKLPGPNWKIYICLLRVDGSSWKHLQTLLLLHFTQFSLPRAIRLKNKHIPKHESHACSKPYGRLNHEHVHTLSRRMRLRMIMHWADELDCGWSRTDCSRLGTISQKESYRSRTYAHLLEYVSSFAVKVYHAMVLRKKKHTKTHGNCTMLCFGSQELMLDL